MKSASTASLVFVLAACAAAASAVWAARPDAPVRTVTASMSPERLWKAVRMQPELTAGAQVHATSFRAEAAVGSDPQAWSLDVDWDEASGGALMHLTGRLATDDAWVARVLQQGEALPHENKYCRGPNPDWSVPEPSIDAAHSCDYGNFSSAIHELEKCGDHETTLRLLAACVRTGHAAGLVRIAQLYETGMGLPRRPERMARFLRLASQTQTPGYALGAKVMYATAVYFGEGVPADKAEGLKLMREAAQAGDEDARRFLREGWHAAWRRTDGTLYSDPGLPARLNAQSPRAPNAAP